MRLMIKNTDPMYAWGIVFTALLTCGVIIALKLISSDPVLDPGGLICFLLLTAAAELSGSDLFRINRNKSVPISQIVSLSALLVLGPYATAWSQIIGGFISSFNLLISKKSGPVSFGTWFNTMLNQICSHVLPIAAAGWVFLALGGGIGDIIHPDNFLPLLAAVAVETVIHSLIQVGIQYFKCSKPVESLLKREFYYGFTVDLPVDFLGSIALSIAYLLFGVFGTIVFCLPFVFTGYSFSLYTSKMKTYVERLESLNADLNEAHIGLIETMSEIIDAYDVYTYGHSTQVAVYAGAIAARMGLSTEEQDRVVKASLVHDIGKIGIYDDIVSKPGPLAEEEFTIMKQHPKIGAQILSRMKALRDLVPIVEHHHERWDGKGYPGGLKGEEIPLGARILAVADSIDAMCSDRPYRSTRNFGEVLREVRACSGSQFDPIVVEAFLKLAAEKDSSYFLNSAAKVDRIVMIEQLNKTSPYVSRFLKKGLAFTSKNA
jgi:putative nucleotidyltransferase with HDIG domain